MLKPMRLYVVNLFTGLLPATRLYGLKRTLYRWGGVELGDNVRIVSSARILGSGQLIIDDNTFIGHQTLILLGGGSISIGKNVDISSNVTIVNGTHEIATTSIKAAGKGYADDICIGEGCWVGVCATIIAGAQVKEGAIVAAGALVNGSVDALSIVGGVPCKVIKKRHVEDRP